MIYVATIARFHQGIDSKLAADGVLEAGEDYPRRPTVEFVVDEVPTATLAAVRSAAEGVGPISSLSEGDKVLVIKTKAHKFSWGEVITVRAFPFGHGRTKLRITSLPKLGIDTDGTRWNWRNIVVVHRRLSELVGSDKVSKIELIASE